MRQTTQQYYQISVLVMVWAGVHSLLFWQFGIRNLFDSADYIHRADYFLTNGTLEDTHQIFYAVPIVVLTFFRWLFPQQLLPFLLFQSVLSGVATLALYRSGSKVFNHASAGFICAVLFLCWWDNIHWNTVIMTESLLCSFTCFLVFLLVYFEGKRRQYYAISLLLVLIFFTRPTGIVIILGTIVFLLRYHWRTLEADLLKKYSVLLLCLLFACSGAAMMFTQWDFTDQYRRGNIVTYIDTVEGTSLYSNTLQLNADDLILASEELPAIQKMWLFVYHNPIHFFRAAFLKVGFLLAGVRPYYSFLHNSYLIAWMAGLYFLSFQGWRTVKTEPITIFTMAIVLVNCALIGMSTVDWDNRFYIPMEPGILLLAGGGGTTVLEWVRKRVNTRSVID